MSLALKKVLFEFDTPNQERTIHIPSKDKGKKLSKPQPCYSQKDLRKGFSGEASTLIMNTIWTFCKLNVMPCTKQINNFRKMKYMLVCSTRLKVVLLCFYQMSSKKVTVRGKLSLPLVSILP